MDIQRIWTFREFMRINQSTAGFVVCISGEMVPDVELSLRLYGLRKRAHKAMHLFLCWLGSGNCVRSRQPGKVLAEAVPRNKAVEICIRVKVVRVVVPPAHIRTRSGQSLTLAERLEERVFIQVQEEIMISVELLAQRTLEQLDVRIVESRKSRLDRHGRRVVLGKCSPAKGIPDGAATDNGGASLEKLPA